MRTLPLALLMLPACSPSPSFSRSFSWGAAIAGFQAEMGCPTLSAEQCEDRNSDWYAFITQPADDLKSIVKYHPPSQGPGFWELYDQDFAQAKDEVALNSVRLSLEWSRIFKTATDGVEGYDALRGVADVNALAGYHAIFASMQAHGLRPLVTLNHYSLPSWIHDGVGCHQDFATCTRRGWVDRDRIVREIAKYAGFVAREFGDEVDVWATLNEPLAVALPGYLFPSADRANPPALRFQYQAARTAMAAMIEAHARMYDAVHAGDAADADRDGRAAEVGLVFNITPTVPKDPSSARDQRGARNVSYLYNTAFLNAVCNGDLDEELTGKPVHREDLAGRMDYLGVNYYTRITVEGADEAQLPELSSFTTFNPLTLGLWEVYPQGLYEVARDVRNTYGLPIRVTENGAVDAKDEGIAPQLLADHVEQLERAANEGVEVRGYYYWTLMDNYEWNHGTDLRLGLFAVDPVTKERRARQTVGAYRAIIERH